VLDLENSKNNNYSLRGCRNI